MSGSALRKLRRELGLTQAELGSKVARDQTTICKYERLRALPPDFVLLLKGAGLLPTRRRT